MCMTLYNPSSSPIQQLLLTHARIALFFSPLISSSFSSKTINLMNSNSLHWWQMVFNKVFFFFYNFIGFRSKPRFKQATLFSRCGNLNLRPMTPDDCSVVAVSSPEKALEGETCCVCLSSMGNKGVGTSVLPCLHQFHKVCVERWFNECRRTCPICRYSMEGGESHEDGSNQILTDEMVIWFSSFHTSGFWALLVC